MKVMKGKYDDDLSEILVNKNPSPVEDDGDDNDDDSHDNDDIHDRHDAFDGSMRSKGVSYLLEAIADLAAALCVRLSSLSE